MSSAVILHNVFCHAAVSWDATNRREKTVEMREVAIPRKEALQLNGEPPIGGHALQSNGSPMFSLICLSLKHSLQINIMTGQPPL